MIPRQFILVRLGELQLTIGRFLLASLQLDNIARYNRVDYLNHYLDNLPSKLETAYHELWERVTKDDGSPGPQCAKLILMWVTLAKRPLAVKTLAQALSTLGHGSINDPISGEEMVAFCKGFLRTGPSGFRRALTLFGVVIAEGSESEKLLKRLESMVLAGHASMSPNGCLHGRSYNLQVDDPCVVTFVHSAARQHFERKQQCYFPNGHDDIVTACLEVLNSEEVTYASRHFILYSMLIWYPSTSLQPADETLIHVSGLPSSPATYFSC